MTELEVVGYIIIAMLVILVFIGFAWEDIRRKSLHSQAPEFAQRHGFIYSPAGGDSKYDWKFDSQDGPETHYYASFEHFPFNTGLKRVVSFVIEGVYQQATFRAFEYTFHTRLGRYMQRHRYSIVMIRTPRRIPQIPGEVFWENGSLVQYVKGHFDPDTILDRVEYLVELANHKA